MASLGCRANAVARGIRRVGVLIAFSGLSYASSKRCPLASPASRRFLHSLYLINQELSEEVHEFVVRIERKNMRDMMVGTHDHQCALRAVNPAQDEDVRSVPDVRRESLLVVDVSELALARQ